MLKGLIKGTIIFLSGVGVGYIIADTMKEEEYKEKAREEINEVKAIYKEKIAEMSGDVNKETKIIDAEIIEEDDSEEIEEYKHRAKVYDYAQIYNDKAKNDEEIKPKVKPLAEDNYPPYVINEDEYGEFDDYDTKNLTYFMEDKKLVDEDIEDVIKDVDSLIGLENLKIFDDFPDCTGIYVRNDDLKIDFEILKDDFSWSEEDK